MRAFLPLSTAALALALAGCNSRTNDNATPSATEEAAADAMPADAGATDAAMAGDATAPMTAQAFVDAAAASDMFELESSKLADKTSKDTNVRAFAAMMIKDHTKSSADLKAAAAKATPAVTVAPKLTAEQQADLDALKAASGDAFDKLYGQKQAAGHEKALAMLQSYAASGDAPALKDFAGKTAPVVSGHLDRAKKLPM